MAQTLYQIAGGKRKRIVFLPQAETAPLALFFGQGEPGDVSAGAYRRVRSLRMAEASPVSLSLGNLEQILKHAREQV